ncbi:MAG: TylF/MycF family methyltransferase [Candidatus Nomurabacteria bacterium]|jgi:hypothetical protein|nr:TylF/MycF family methyltransferase [Candidatus Nomurabacteria bacterium]
MKQIEDKSLAVILAELKKVLDANIKGDIVELGCYKGETSIEIAKVLAIFSGGARRGCPKNVFTELSNQQDKQVKNIIQEKILGADRATGPEKLINKKLWLYDSFSGLPEKSKEDLSAIGESFQKGELFCTKAEVITKFAKANLPKPVIKKAWFSDLKPEDLPNEICFALLDGDFYDSIKTSLELIENNLTKNATIIIDDFANPALPGARQATEEWLTKIKSKTNSKPPQLKLQQLGALAIINMRNIV